MNEVFTTEKPNVTDEFSNDWSCWIDGGWAQF